MPSLEIQENLDACLALLSDADDRDWSRQRSYGEDAVTAVAYALRTRLSGESQDAAWAARLVYEALDNFLHNRPGLYVGGEAAVAKELSHPLIQGEFGRQRRDLDDLAKLEAQSEWRQSLSALQTRAKADAYYLLQLH